MAMLVFADSLHAFARDTVLKRSKVLHPNCTLALSLPCYFNGSSCSWLLSIPGSMAVLITRQHLDADEIFLDISATMTS